MAIKFIKAMVPVILSTILRALTRYRARADCGRAIIAWHNRGQNQRLSAGQSGKLPPLPK